MAGVSIQLPVEKQQELKKICGGKFTFVVIGPSQHGKTTFLKEIVGVNELEDTESEKYAIGTGQGSVTKEMHIWQQESYSTQIEVQFVDTPGLSDSRANANDTDENSDDSIKEKILSFLKDNNPQCVMLFHKFPAEITVFRKACEFANQISVLYKCPVLFIHTNCDASTTLSSYPQKFAGNLFERHAVIQNTMATNETEGERLLVKYCFEDWKNDKERKVKEVLDKSALFFASFSGFRPFGKVILPDGINPMEHLMETIQKAIGESLLIISMEHAKNLEARRLAESKIRNSILGCLGGLTVIGVAEAAATGLVLGTPIIGLPVAGLICLGVYFANKKK